MLWLKGRRWYGHAIASENFGCEIIPSSWKIRWPALWWKACQGRGQRHPCGRLCSVRSGRSVHRRKIWNVDRSSTDRYRSTVVLSTRAHVLLRKMQPLLVFLIVRSIYNSTHALSQWLLHNLSGDSVIRRWFDSIDDSFIRIFGSIRIVPELECWVFRRKITGSPGSTLKI